MNKEHLATDLEIQHSNNFVCMNNNFELNFFISIIISGPIARIMMNED